MKKCDIATKKQNLVIVLDIHAGKCFKDVQVGHGKQSRSQESVFLKWSGETLPREQRGRFKRSQTARRLRLRSKGWSVDHFILLVAENTSWQSGHVHDASQLSRAPTSVETRQTLNEEYLSNFASSRVKRHLPSALYHLEFKLLLIAKFDT